MAPPKRCSLAQEVFLDALVLLVGLARLFGSLVARPTTSPGA